MLSTGGGTSRRGVASHETRVSVLILDGRGLAERRRHGIAARARAVRERRGRPPRLALIAFTDAHGAAPHVLRKVRACHAVHVEGIPVLLDGDIDTDAALLRMHAAIGASAFDAVFLQFPFPAGVNGDALAAAIPPALDLDVMTPARIRQYEEDPAALPPATVSAGIELLDAYGVDVEGMAGAIVASPSPFADMFREALVRRGADMQPVLDPAAPDLAEVLHGALLVVVAAARPGAVRSNQLAPGTVAIDAGYFNGEGGGDVDVTGGIEHLAALAPVPGGIGPMTVSVLTERVVAMAEHG